MQNIHVIGYHGHLVKDGEQRVYCDWCGEPTAVPTWREVHGKRRCYCMRCIATMKEAWQKVQPRITEIKEAA